MKLLSLASLAILLIGGVAFAQSLGELAEQERAKRKKTGAKAYTNEDLDAGKAPSPSPSPSATPGPAPSPSPSPRRRPEFRVPPAPKAPGETGGKSQPSERESPSSEGDTSRPDARGQGQNEEYWRGQREAREKAVKAAEDQIKAIEQRMAELGSDLNPNAADVMDPDRLRKRDAELRAKADELVQAKDALAKARQDLANLDDEARLAGVPPGWLR
jgi:hypothetical protein